MNPVTLLTKPRFEQLVGEPERAYIVGCYDLLRKDQTQVSSRPESLWRKCDWDSNDRTDNWIFLAQEREPAFWSTLPSYFQKHSTELLQACISAIAMYAVQTAFVPHDRHLLDIWLHSSNRVFKALPPAVVEYFPSVPAVYQEPVKRVVDLISNAQFGVLEMPRVERDPDDLSASWISIPVKCQGSVDDVLDSYDRLVKELVVALTPDQIQHIRIDIIMD